MVDSEPYDSSNAATIGTLTLPNVTTVGAGAFGTTYSSGGAVLTQARNFSCPVSLPAATDIGAYAFNLSAIPTISIPNAVTIGTSAFYLAGSAGQDPSAGYGISLSLSIQSIGDSAFSGRAVTTFSVPATAVYSIGKNAFAFTQLTTVDLGTVSSIGIGAFDGIKTLQYFTVNKNNQNYASFSTESLTTKGNPGALYSLDSADAPVKIMKMPAGILNANPAIITNNSFTVADGVTSMDQSAFTDCPAISVDLNDITSIPAMSFGNTSVTSVTAKNVTSIGSGAFASCGSLTTFVFTNSPLNISDMAFYNTVLNNIQLPKGTTMGSGSFANITSQSPLTVGIWGDTQSQSDSFTNTNIWALKVSSNDATTDAGAEHLYANWNANNWVYEGSDTVQRLVIDNQDSSQMDISGLTTNGIPNNSELEITHGFTYLNLTGGGNTLQFVEYKDEMGGIPLATPFHMQSVKSGVYLAESHSNTNDIWDGLNQNYTVGECSQGDNVTWELEYEFYNVVFYAFDAPGSANYSDQTYTNPALTTSMNPADRIEFADQSYLSGNQLIDIPYPDYAQYSLLRWCTADTPNPPGSVTDPPTTLISANSIATMSYFGGDVNGVGHIPESWVYRDPDTDQGTLYVYALFTGKQLTVDLEADVTGGQNGSSAPTPNAAGGTVQLTLASTNPAGFNSGGLSTSAVTGKGSVQYPYGLGFSLTATPNPGYAFVGWGVYVNGSNTPTIYTMSDRSYVNASDPVVSWPDLTLYKAMKFVAFFAPIVSVTFDTNSSAGSGSPINFVIGDTLVESNNAYDGFDYANLLSTSTDASTTGNGISYYPGTPTQADLTFGGWYSGSTPYAGFDGTDLTTLSPLTGTPGSSMTLTAKWYAEITYYPNNGINTGATMPSMPGVLTQASSDEYTYQLDVGKYTSGTGYNGILPSTIVPSIAGVNFNGWYVLSGGTNMSNIATVTTGTNHTNPYPDVYPTLERFEIGAGAYTVQGNMSLMALYAADVNFYFNGATLDDGAMSYPIAASPYTVTVPASLSSPITLGDTTYFNAINTDMQNADTTGGIYKTDSMDQREYFLNWYKSTDGTTPPVGADTVYDSSSDITANVNLIAGWGYKISFTDDGVSGTITDTTTHSTWVPGSIYVLEGTGFQLSNMPSILLNNTTPPSAWYDADATPYVWFTDTTPLTDFTYSVRLTPEFNELFIFDLMGGNLGGSPTSIVSVGYSSTESFSDVLNAFYAQIQSGTQYMQPAKTGLYYENTGTIASGDMPNNIVWYKSDGVSASGIVYIGNESTLVGWNPSDLIGSDNHAYIRWLADVSFDVNVPSGDSDGGTSSAPSTITVDENTPFTSLTPTGALPIAIYNSAGDKAFSGWFETSTGGGMKYTGPDGIILSAAGNVTRSLTLYAGWAVQVKFYYDATAGISATPPSGATTGSDAIGNYIIVNVSGDGTVTAPTLTRTGFSAAPSYLWFKGGFGSAYAPLSVDQILPSSAPSAFNPSDISNPITVNTTVYANWYATVRFTLGLGTASSFFTQTTKYLLEGTTLSDQGTQQDLDAYNGDMEESDYGWIFIGWYDQSALTSSSDYEDLGIQYYSTGFDYMQNGSPPSDSDSVLITGDVTLNHEYVVLVNFDPNYTGAATIQSQYLRVGQPLPGSGDARFTDIPARVGVIPMGWYDLVTSIRYADGTGTPDTGNLVQRSMTLTAAWQVTVSFYDLQGYLGSGLILNVDGVKITQDFGTDGIANTNDDVFTMPEGTTLREFIGADPTAVSGKQFVSWFVGSAGDGTYTNGDVMFGLTTQFMEDTVLTAGYGYTIQFDTNGGTPSAIPNALVIEGQSINLPESPAKGRLTFEGWDDGSGTVTAAGASVTPTAAITYTAKWLVVVTLYDGISLSPIATLQWDEDAGPSFVSSDYSTITSTDYSNKVTEVDMSWTDTTGTHNVTLNKFIDQYDSSTQNWVTLFSVFNGWMDPFTGQTLASSVNLYDWLMSNTDSAALFATWQERVDFYSISGSVSTSYVDTGSYLGAVAPSGADWANKYAPTTPLNSNTYRITNSMDLIEVQSITVTLDGNGGTPQTQVFNNVISGTMLGALGAQDPVRSGMYFAGWYDGNTKYSFTDILYGDITLTAKWSPVPVNWYTIFAVAYDNASITPSGMIKAMQGDTLIFSYNVGMGYSPILTVDGQQVTASPSQQYVFANINSDHSIEVSAVNSGARGATSFLTIDVNGKGSVLYSTDGGKTFASYSTPLPIYDGVNYTLNAVPNASSYFDHWSGGASGNNPYIDIMPANGSPSITVTANFGSSAGAGFGGGQLAILNLICMVLAILISIVAFAATYQRNYEGTGTGKAMRLGAILLAVISLVIFLLTEGFSGSHVIHDSWTIVMFILLVCVTVLALASLRYDFNSGEEIDTSEKP